MTTQIAVKLPDATVEELDRLVRAGRFANRSDAVRVGLALVLDRDREQAIDRAFAAGFARLPDTDSDLEVAKALGNQSINDEPWDPWW